MDAYNNRPKDAAGNLALLKQLQTGKAAAPAAGGQKTAAAAAPAAAAPAAAGGQKTAAAAPAPAAAPAAGPAAAGGQKTAAAAPGNTSIKSTTSATLSGVDPYNHPNYQTYYQQELAKGNRSKTPTGEQMAEKAAVLRVQKELAQAKSGSQVSVNGAPPVQVGGSTPAAPAAPAAAPAVASNNVAAKPSGGYFDKDTSAWVAQYGNTHNPDGTPKPTPTPSQNVKPRPTVVGKPSQAVLNWDKQYAATHNADGTIKTTAQGTPAMRPIGTVNSSLTKSYKNLLRENKLTPVEQIQYFRSIIIENPYTPPPMGNPSPGNTPGANPQTPGAAPNAASAAQAASQSWATRNQKIIDLTKKIASNSAALLGFITKNTASGLKSPARLGLKGLGFAVGAATVAHLAKDEFTGSSNLIWSLGGSIADLIKSSGPAMQDGGGTLANIFKKVMGSWQSNAPQQPGQTNAPQQPGQTSQQQSQAVEAMKGHYADLMSVARHFKDANTWEAAMSNEKSKNEIIKVVKCASEALSIDWQKAFADAAKTMERENFKIPTFVAFDQAVLQQIKCEYETSGEFKGRTKF